MAASDSTRSYLPMSRVGLLARGCGGKLPPGALSLPRRQRRVDEM